jgi:hypothetical protein
MLLRNSTWLASGIFLLTFATLGGISESQTTIKNKKDPKKEWAVVKGFRSALFGMDEKQVLGAIAKDFKISKLTIEKKIKRAVHPTQKTKILSFIVPKLMTSGGDAEVTYIMGYKSKRLIQVNVRWGSGVKVQKSVPKVPAKDILATANLLRDYFMKKKYKKKGFVTNGKINDTLLIVFRGRDEKNRMVVLVLTSTKNKENQPKANLISLSLSYMQNPEKLDVFDITK